MKTFLLDGIKEKFSSAHSPRKLRSNDLFCVCVCLHVTLWSSRCLIFRQGESVSCVRDVYMYMYVCACVRVTLWSSRCLIGREGLCLVYVMCTCMCVHVYV